MSVSQHGAGTFRISVSVGLQNNDVIVTESRHGVPPVPDPPD